MKNLLLSGLMMLFMSVLFIPQTDAQRLSWDIENQPVYQDTIVNTDSVYIDLGAFSYTGILALQVDTTVVSGTLSSEALTIEVKLHTDGAWRIGGVGSPTVDYTDEGPTFVSPWLYPRARLKIKGGGTHATIFSVYMGYMNMPGLLPATFTYD